MPNQTTASIFDNILSKGVLTSWQDIVINIIIAFILGVIISWIYRRTHRGYSYSNSFISTLTILSMVTAFVMMVIGNNIARAFSLVGALSIIRFRTAVKDTRDTAFVFLSLAVGMAVGTGSRQPGSPHRQHGQVLMPRYVQPCDEGRPRQLYAAAYP